MKHIGWMIWVVAVTACSGTPALREFDTAPASGSENAPGPESASASESESASESASASASESASESEFESASASPPPPRTPPCRTPTRVATPAAPRRARGAVQIVWHQLLRPDESEGAMLELDHIEQARQDVARFIEHAPLAQLTRCYDQALRADGALSGGMQVRMVNREGRLARVEIVERTFGDDALASCVVRAIETVRRAPTSPFVMQLGFCPTHRAACFVGSPGGRDLPARSDALEPLLTAAEPSLAACVAERLSEQANVAGALVVDMTSYSGFIGGTGAPSEYRVGFDARVHSAVFNCASTAVGALCFEDTAERAYHRVTVMVHTPR